MVAPPRSDASVADTNASIGTHPLSQGCPAFKSGAGGCPFSPAVSSPHSDAAVEAAKKCPAFGSGCAFKDAQSLAELEEMLAKIPDSHKIGGQTFGSSAALRQLLEAIHVNAVAKARAGMGDCPVFSTNGCPFKNVTSRGTPLVAELEYRAWSIFDSSNDDEEDGDVVPGNTDDTNEVDKTVKGAHGAEIKSSASLSTSQLAHELKQGTKKSHRAAENVGFVRNFVKGRIDRKLYKHMLLSLWHTYTTLEEELRRNCDNEVYRELHFPDALERKGTLEDDIEFFFGPRWRDHPDVIVGPSPCTLEYMNRIRAVGRDAPELLVAHAYTRYLGDLSGGQVLARVAVKAMDLPEDGSGTAFYRFPEIPSAKLFKEEYRRLLDETKVDPKTCDLIVAEANLAFVMNMRVFEELDVMAGDADSVRPLNDVLATLDMPVRENDKCPFASLGGINPHASGEHDAANGGSTSMVVAACPIPHQALAWVQPILLVIIAVVVARIAAGSVWPELV